MKKLPLIVFLTLILFGIFTLRIEAQEESKKTICLNMIVKNENDIIEDCLASIKHLIDYWVIVDTGSEDGTQETIKNFLKDIPGELHERPWVNFEHNRNEALSLAKSKADYSLFIDADERWAFSNEFTMPLLDLDYYRILIREVGVIDSMRKCLVKNSLNWKYEGVLHEVITSPQARIYANLKDVISLNNTALGARTKDPKKYYKDAQVLEAALQQDPNNSRHIFYLGQCYGNAHEYSLAIKYFEKRASMGNKDLEVFWSLYCIGKMEEKLNIDIETPIASYSKTYQSFPDRAEPLYRIANLYFKNKNYLLSYLVSKYALTIPKPQDATFVEDWLYEWGLLQQYANSSYHLENYEEAKLATQTLLSIESLPSDLFLTFQRNLELLNQMLKK